MPRVVVAGVPTRIPDATLGGLASNGIAFLLTVMPTSSSSASASRPVTPSGVTSTSARWLSVPPLTSRAPASASVWARTRAFSIVRAWSRRNSPDAASLNATALAATTCISGPPWTPGNTDLSIGLRERALAERREVGAIDALGEVRAREHHAATRPAQRLVGGGGDEVGVRERARVQPGRDEPGDVGHVDEQQRADAVGDRRHPLEVPRARVGGGPGDDDLRPDLGGLRREGVVVDPLVLAGDAVRVHLVQAAREVDRRAVGEVTAVGEVHAQDPVARLAGPRSRPPCWPGRPECGWTLTWSAPGNSASARSRARFSAMSTYSQPP